MIIQIHLYIYEENKEMADTCKANEIEIGYHPEGYRIDKTASAMNRYTKWDVQSNDKWSNPAPVCFDSLPPEGWYKCDGFDWSE